MEVQVRYSENVFLRVMRYWNRLPKEVVEVFKKHVGVALRDMV